MLSVRALLTCISIGCFWATAQAAPENEAAICGGQTAIVAVWECGAPGSGEFCTLWGVDTPRAGQWTDQSLFVIEEPNSVRRVGYEEACIGGRCSRPYYAICSIPVSHGKSAQLDTLLRQ